MQYYQDQNYLFKDFDFIIKDDWLYAMYIKKEPYPQSELHGQHPNWYGLARTHDGFTWENVADILMPVSDTWEESIWAGSIRRDKDQYVIYYSAVQMVPHRASTCKIGKAYSSDLINWKKDPANPVFEFDPTNPYYSDEPDIAFRDPFSFDYQGKRYVLFCARDKQQPEGKRGCVGIAEETKPNTFSYMQPLYSPGTTKGGLECPALYHIKGKWYLLWGDDTTYVMRYAISDSPFGPFTEPSQNQLLPPEHYIGRIVNFKGTLFYYYWYRDVHNGMHRVRLASPYKVDIQETGEIRLNKI